MQNFQEQSTDKNVEFIEKKRERSDNTVSYDEKKENSFNKTEVILNNPYDDGENVENINKENFKDEVTENITKIVSILIKDPTNCLLITNLQRPFVNSSLESLLTKFGKINNFWLDFIKTHCYVKYENIIQAIEARESLNGMIWPADGKKLIVEFVPESEILRAMEKNQSSSSNPTNEKDKIASLKAQIKPIENLLNTNTSKSINNQSEEEPVKTLESLFRKTETKPHIYYLPLSEIEVQEKRVKLSNNKEQLR